MYGAKAHLRDFSSSTFASFLPFFGQRSHILDTGVSRELGDVPNAVGTVNSLVGYSIRLESGISRNTRLAFVTNGIALRMLEGGTGQGGQGTAFDEITVSNTLSVKKPILTRQIAHNH